MRSLAHESGLATSIRAFRCARQSCGNICLGPTLLGLGAVGLLFCIPLILKIVRIFAGPRWPGSGGRRGPDASTRDGEGEFDADAVLDRYMARRSAEAAPGSPAAPPAHEGGGPEGRPNFGRRIR